MSSESLLERLLQSNNADEAAEAAHSFVETTEGASWYPIGNRPNNRGVIEVSANPGRAVVERVTNAIDAVLEFEYLRHGGRPPCGSPREAAQAWLNVPAVGLSGLSTVDRRNLAKNVTLHLRPGAGVANRTLAVVDRGSGLSAEEMPSTILSLNESNKVLKSHLAGTYGQGGSATFAATELTLIASRKPGADTVAFTVVRYEPPPPEAIKGGSYVYLVCNGSVLSGTSNPGLPEHGTMCLHFGYDLTKFPSPLGPNSVYGLLQQVMFDPVIPVWLDDEVHGYRRVIKGSRNALNGAVDEGDEGMSKISHHMAMFFVSLGDYGRAGIEYWVLDQPTKSKSRPTASYVDPMKPIVLTLNGQNQAEMTVRVVRKEAELPYLAQRLICHVDCNSLTPAALRSLFASSREEARRGAVLDLLEKEVVRALRSDDELERLNMESRDQKHREEDEEAEKTMRREVGRLLQLQGFQLSAESGAAAGGEEEGRKPKPRKKGGRKKPVPIPTAEPPTYIKILSPEDQAIEFFPEQRRYIRIETDANATYHDPQDPRRSAINIVVQGEGFIASGSTPLQGGRMRVVLSSLATAPFGSKGTLSVELRVPGQSTLSDARDLFVIKPPPAKPARDLLVMPPFDVKPVEDRDDPMWTTLGWPDDVTAVASSAEREEGKLVVYYSRVFPNFVQQFESFERRDATLAGSFEARYKIWLAVHSLIIDKEQTAIEVEEEIVQQLERSERCRMATIAAMFAAAEAKRVEPLHDE